MTRRQLQIALGLFWLLDGALQLQPFMLGTGFSRLILDPIAAGQPHWVSAPIRWGANMIAAHPVAWDVPVAVIQLLIGLGLLVPRTAKLALAGSIAWALGVWYLGEGLSGLASGHASLLTGAPGSALLYAVLASAAWPALGSARQAPARWLPLAWAALWVGGAVYQALPGQNTGTAVAGAIKGGGAPGWLGRLDNSLAGWATQHGTSVVVALVVVTALIGLGALHPRSRGPAVAGGLLLALAIWLTGQDVGQLYSAQATDPNSAPLIALMAIAVLGDRRPHPGARVSGAGTRPVPSTQPGELAVTRQK
ncbi:MAG: hypothetical protein QOG80_2420 [Pseudonocardiales bacterium]|jgi:hypothetical protein|nr:hypothetical protein [Pseudonocardiales bacterium]